MDKDEEITIIQDYLNDFEKIKFNKFTQDININSKFIKINNLKLKIILSGMLYLKL
jgi:hypothetical protein